MARAGLSTALAWGCPVMEGTGGAAPLHQPSTNPTASSSPSAWSPTRPHTQIGVSSLSFGCSSHSLVPICCHCRDAMGTVHTAWGDPVEGAVLAAQGAAPRLRTQLGFGWDMPMLPSRRTQGSAGGWRWGQRDPHHVQELHTSGVCRVAWQGWLLASPRAFVCLLLQRMGRALPRIQELTAQHSSIPPGLQVGNVSADPYTPALGLRRAALWLL